MALTDAEVVKTKEDHRPKSKTTGVKLTRQLRRFCEETTAHGLGPFIRERSVVGQMCWFVIFLGSLVGIFWHLSVLVGKFLAYDTQRLIQTSHEPAKFPSVSLCNSQQISNSNREELRDHESMQEFQEMVEDTKATALALGVPWEDVDDRIMSPLAIYENMGTEFAAMLGHHRQDFIIHCSVSREECDQDIKFAHVNPTYFNCFTFTGSGNVGSGPQNGLSIILYLEVKNSTEVGQNKMQYDQYSPVQNAIGARVVIHEPGTMALPVTAGIDVMPGHSSSLAVSVEVQRRLGQPYSNCFSSPSTVDRPEYLYTSDSCMLMCAQKYIHENCGCLDPYLPTPYFLNAAPFCGKFGYNYSESFFSRIDCERVHKTQFQAAGDNHRQRCKCYLPCTEYTYRTTMSESAWPGEQYVDDFFEDMILVPHLNGTTTNAYTQLKKTYEQSRNSNVTDPKFARLIRENFARVNVYFRDLDVIIQKEKPSYAVSNLWSDIGGTIGLWAGLSLITLFECIALIARMISTCCRW